MSHSHTICLQSFLTLPLATLSPSLRFPAAENRTSSDVIARCFKLLWLHVIITHTTNYGLSSLTCSSQLRKKTSLFCPSPSIFFFSPDCKKWRGGVWRWGKEINWTQASQRGFLTVRTGLLTWCLGIAVPVSELMSSPFPLLVGSRFQDTVVCVHDLYISFQRDILPTHI